MLGLFKKKPKVEFTSQPLTVDFHSHFLPGLDDGCATLEDSISLLKIMESYGYKKLIMSPHVMGDFYKNTPEMIDEKLQLVKEEASRQDIHLTLEASAEYYLDEWFGDKIKNKTLVPFAGNHILFEISYMNEPRNLYETIFNLQVSGYKPILAHPERYKFFHDRFDQYEKLVENNCMLQVNLLSLIGYYGYAEKKIADKFIEKKMVHFVSSDAHRLNHVDLLKKVFGDQSFAKAVQIVKNSELL
jgi:protein-tyrosine phosphatase